MRKTLAAANRGERVPFKIPRSVQQSIPIQRVWQDGIWQVNGRFSQTWRFADINYSLASYEDQRDMFTSYCGVLNSLPTDAVTKITIHNRRLNSSDFQHSVLMRECGDDLDLYRREYNRVLTEKAAASNNLIQDKYITVSVARKNAEEARAFFHRVDADTETLLSKSLCDFSILRYQQEDGFNTALPYGLRSIDVTRTLTTEAAASLMPFRVQEIQDMGGIYCGVNAVSKNLLICNRKNLLNPHGFILGVSGSGKSFTMKEFITFIALSTNDDIIIIDAEREYGDLVRALRGIVLEISPNSRHHINPLEIARGYGMGENPVALKSELLMSICEQQMGEGQLGAFHKSIIDRCTASVYHDFIKSGGKARQPILSDWRNEIKRQPEREAQELALASELFVEGSLNMFAHETNVDIDSRIIVFDLYEMGDQLKPTALNVTMETIQNRVATNRLAGKYTWVFVDEVYVRPEAA
ncbi:hypothetical protein F260042K2_31810 [Flavonifractor plautii]|uniref:VirB4-like conjugal transfer ATPase, CD1110 family n=1 Tax=Flavonifractor plautii TaxID=292800 RepID=UPI0034B0E121